MASGIVKKWIGDRGFGFIKPDGGQQDVFVHAKAFPLDVTPVEGDRVSFEVVVDSTRNRPQAVNVRPI